VSVTEEKAAEWERKAAALEADVQYHAQVADLHLLAMRDARERQRHMRAIADLVRSAGLRMPVPLRRVVGDQERAG
jgi:hypothetical protein